MNEYIFALFLLKHYPTPHYYTIGRDARTVAPTVPPPPIIYFLSPPTKVENVLEATHLVAGGSGVPLKRTPKLLAGLGCCRYVLDVEWLYQSAKEGKLLEGLEYVLCDAEVCAVL